jgi:uncharacterized protein YdeI (YjbR/CyaY-like superfamily)
VGVQSDAERLALRDAAAWRAWLTEHHASSGGVWLLRARAGSERELITYFDAVRQALCFGWVDGTVKPMDEETVGIWFAPRRPSSGWAATNKARIVELERSGEMTDVGRAVIAAAKATGMWEVLDGPEAGVEPPELTAALDAVPAARAHWDAFPASARKMGLTAIAMAKRPETRAARVAKLVTDAAEGKRP